MFVAFEVFSSIGLFSFVTGAALVFMDAYQLSSTDFGNLFAGVSLVMILSVYSNKLLLGHRGIERMMWLTVPGIATSAVILTLLTFLSQPPLWLYVLLFCAYLAPVMMTRINATAGAIKCLPNLAGTTASLISTISLAAGGIIGVEMSQLYQISNNALVLILFISATANLSLFIACISAGLLKDS